MPAKITINGSSITIGGNVTGNVKAGGSINAKSVQGSIKAGGSVNVR